MSHISEHDSEDNKSSQDTEYHSESGNELESGEYTLSSPDQWNSILHVRFPMPHTFPQPYLTLNEVLKFDETLNHTRNNIIAEDPDEALHYIINHFHVNGVAKSIRQYPDLFFEQVYYSTYIEPRRFIRLQQLIDLASKNRIVDTHRLTISHPISCNVCYSSNHLHRPLFEHPF